jgi:hypothetical protein
VTSGALDGLERYSLLASALSGRDLQVAASAPNKPSWTDGRTVFLDANASSSEQVRAVAVQASLLAAGSLEPDVMRRLAWRLALARRYLSVEGHRALAANEHLLPASARTLFNRDIATRVDSAAASLALALSRQPVAEPPASFGAIRARKILAQNVTKATAASKEDAPSRVQMRELAVLEDDEVGDGSGTIGDFFTLGSGGAIGRLLQPALNVVRQIKAGGPPGADMATHQARPGLRAGSTAVSSIVMSGAAENAAAGEGHGKMYPEWDVHRQCYRPDWCSVREIEPVPQDTAPAAAPDELGLRRSLARLGVSLDRCRRRAQGDDVDIDAAIEARVELIAGSAPDETVYIESIRKRRDLAVLLLLDISGSVGQPGTTGQIVHEQQRAAAAALMIALHEIGDRVALYAFHSQGRSAVDLVPVKRFEDGVEMLVIQRLHGLVPGAFSRLGAAIRHAAAVLKERGGTSRRLLVVLSDGLAYDHGYEPVYGAADARRALAETRNQGIGCLCLSIGAGTDTAVLQRVFGSAAYATMPKAEHLRRQVGPLFRSAMRAAEVRLAKKMKVTQMMGRSF